MSTILSRLHLLTTPFLVFAAFACLIAAKDAKAQQGFENLDRIDGLVATTVGARIGEPGGAVAPVDRRLRLAPCASLPHVDPPVLGAATVSCASRGWRIKVPVLSGGAGNAPMPAIRQRAVEVAPLPPVIRKGDPVQLIAGNDIFTVSRRMIAEEDGMEGASIRVRADIRSPSITARVESAGIVRIPGV